MVSVDTNRLAVFIQSCTLLFFNIHCNNYIIIIIVIIIIIIIIIIAQLVEHDASIAEVIA